MVGIKTVLDSHGYNFKKIEIQQQEEKEPEPPIEEEKKEEQEENSPTKEEEKTPDKSEEEKENNEEEEKDIKLIFSCEKDDLYAIRLKKGQDLYLKK